MTRYCWYDETPPKPIRVYVPSGETVTTAPAGFTVRRRGDTEGTVKHTYRCPVHGQFDVHVRRSDVPDAVACSRRLSDLDSIVEYSRVDQSGSLCGHTSPWAGSLCGIGFAAGEVMG
jgi:hypothetical protein